MLHIPYEKMDISWIDSNQTTNDGFVLTLPWLSMKINVKAEDKNWIKDATAHLHTAPLNENVQKFIQELKGYPIAYIYPRNIESFRDKDLQECSNLAVDSSTPARLLSTFGCPIDPSIQENVISAWTWDQEKILSKARIKGTDLYDPISLITYLICYRLEWESNGWLGQDRFGMFLQTLLKKDEKEFFQAIGWISRQALQVLTEFCSSMEPALTNFVKAKEYVASYIAEEKGHHKFMEQVFRDLDLDKNAFPLAGGTRWLLDSFKHVAAISPLAFSAMVALFEAAYYEEEEAITGAIKLSSRPHAGRGYELHRKVNEEYRHCDVPLHFASYLSPQTRSHALLTVGLFELTLNVLDRMEQKLASSFVIN
ncbi:MAG: hypothetical protein ACOH2E_00695 [Candidatus Paracaedibacter sp.]